MCCRDPAGRRRIQTDGRPNPRRGGAAATAILAAARLIAGLFEKLRAELPSQ